MAVQVRTQWRRLTASGDIMVLKYSWGPATANTLAVHLGDRGWLVVSPPRAPRSVLDELARDGGASVLLAPNAYHYLGQRAWRDAFTQASSWAPTLARARLAERSPDVVYRPAEELAASLPPDVEIVFPEGQKSPDLLLRVEREGQIVWWLGDLFSNTTAGDQIWPLRLVSRLAGSGLGYRRNAKPELVYVRDRAAWLTSVRSAVTERLPTIVIPAHGEPVTEGAAARTLAILS